MANVSVAALLARLVISLGVVIVLMAALAKVARRRMGHGPTRGGDPAVQLQVLSRQSIGKNASVLLVRAGEKGMLLGVTEHSVSLLSETEIPAVPEPATEAAPRSAALTPHWGFLLQRARDVTVRRV